MYKDNKKRRNHQEKSGTFRFEGEISPERGTNADFGIDTYTAVTFVYDGLAYSQS